MPCGPPDAAAARIEVITPATAQFPDGHDPPVNSSSCGAVPELQFCGSPAGTVFHASTLAKVPLVQVQAWVLPFPDGAFVHKDMERVSVSDTMISDHPAV